MSDGFPIGDIIILGAIAAFIILRYRSMLGDKTGRDPSDIARAKQQADENERVIQLPTKEALAASIPTVTFEAFSPEIQGTLRDMNKIDADFTAEGFLEGARSAFEMTIEAYRNRDLETLRMLLDKPLYTQFEAAIKEQEAKGEQVQNTLLSIAKAEIKEAKLQGSKATIRVFFTSDQIQLVKDKSGEIIEGDVSQEVEIDDTWGFSRDLKSSDPNWVIIET